MNIDTSSTAVSSTSTSTSSVQSSSKNSQTDSASFEEEMQSVSYTNEGQAADTVENNVADKKAQTNDQTKMTSSEEQDDHKNGNENFSSSQVIKGELAYNDFNQFNDPNNFDSQNNFNQFNEFSGLSDSNFDNTDILNQNIQSLMNTGDMISFKNSDFSQLSASIDYQTVSMDMNDAMFFTELVQNTDMSMQSIASNLQNTAKIDAQAAEKAANVSETMMNLLSESMKNNQAFRIDFDKDISVIIKVNKDGSIMANFIPGDSAVEEYLKNNIGFLRQRFDDEKLSYSQLSYSQHKEEQERQSKNKKENSDE